MNMHMILLLFIFGALADPQTSFGSKQPVAGAAEWSSYLYYEPAEPAYTRYVSLRQDPFLKQWEKLGTSFTIEFSFSWNPPASSPLTGSWNQQANASRLETRFLPLVNRHPGMTLYNEWSHFSVHLVRTSEGTALVSWAGCGCDAPAMVVETEAGPEQPNLQSCGFGYLLNSDSPRAQGGKRFITPGQWYHVSITFDGDGTEQDTYKSKYARMYINGQFVLSNRWNDPDNNPGREGVCSERPMNWFDSELGWNSDIRLGYLDNQDDPRRKDLNGVSLKEFSVYGITGQMDELRIWKEVRSDKQIANWWDLTFAAKDLTNPSLVGYYNWNRLPPTEDPARPFPNEVTVNSEDPTVAGSPMGYITSSFNAPDSATLWQAGISRDGNNTLTYPKINSVVSVIAKRQETSTGTITNIFQFRGLDPDPSSPSVGSISSLQTPALFPPFEKFALQIWGFSHAWVEASIDGTLKMYRTTTGEEITPGNNVQGMNRQTFDNNETLALELQCVDMQCSNFMSGKTFRDYYLEYYAISVVPYTPNAFLYFNIESECDGHYDVCGVCNGRNETCQCVTYHNFRNVRMAYVLLTYMLDYIVEQIDHTREIMMESLELVSKPNFRAELMSDEVEEQIRELMKFYNGCLENYCHAVYNFAEELNQLPQMNKRDEEDDETPLSFQEEEEIKVNLAPEFPGHMLLFE